MPLARRPFLRRLGGGLMLATTLAGCSDLPDDALAAWQGPAADVDLRRWALAWAVLAPSSHNLQPWRVDLHEPDTITLRVDRTRLLPMTDPWYRQIVVSQGTFLEALVIALRERGVEPEVRLFPEGEFPARALDDRPVARVTWRPVVAAPGDGLFAQLARRHTAKVAYDTARPVAPPALEALRRALGADLPVDFGATTDPARLARLRALCIEASRIELATPRTALESLALTRIGPREIATHRDGIALNEPLVRAAAALGLFDRRRAPAPGDAAFARTMERFEAQCRSAMGFVWLSTDTAAHAAAGTRRSAEVLAGRAFLRLQLAAASIGLQVHPLSQAPQEFEEMAPLYDALHAELVGQPADRRTVQMFCRVGYCAAQPHTPRRGVEAIVTA